MRAVVTTDDGEELVFETEAELRTWLGVPLLQIMTPPLSVPVSDPGLNGTHIIRRTPSGTPAELIRSNTW